ncbi:MAG: SprT family zinc-dependent metalloprotease [Balneolaceae bacterium]
MGTSNYQLKVDGIQIDVVKKDIKNINLRIYRSNGKVRVSTPQRVKKALIRNFIVEKIGWIKRHLKIIEKQLPKQKLKFETGEKHLLFGEMYELVVFEKTAKPRVELIEKHKIHLYVRPGSSIEKKENVMREWYRDHLKERIPNLINKWESRLGVNVKDWGVKKMKTRWGTCNIRDARIWLSLELAKKPVDCLNYVVLHEIAHLHERYHNDHFKSILSKQMPDWRQIESLMNHESDR